MGGFEVIIYGRNTHRDTKVDELGDNVVESLELGDQNGFECARLLSEILHALREFPVTDIEHRKPSS